MLTVKSYIQLVRAHGRKVPNRKLFFGNLRDNLWEYIYYMLLEYKLILHVGYVRLSFNHLIKEPWLQIWKEILIEKEDEDVHQSRTSEAARDDQHGSGSQQVGWKRGRYYILHFHEVLCIFIFWVYYCKLIRLGYKVPTSKLLQGTDYLHLLYKQLFVKYSLFIVILKRQNYLVLLKLMKWLWHDFCYSRNLYYARKKLSIWTFHYKYQWTQFFLMQVNKINIQWSLLKF